MDVDHKQLVHSTPWWMAWSKSGRQNFGNTLNLPKKSPELLQRLWPIWQHRTINTLAAFFKT